MRNSQAVWSLQPAVAGVLGTVSNDGVWAQLEKKLEKKIIKFLRWWDPIISAQSPIPSKEIAALRILASFLTLLGWPETKRRARNIFRINCEIFVSVTLFSVQVTAHRSYLPPGCPCTPLGKWILGKTVDFAQTTDRWDPHWCLEQNRSQITSLTEHNQHNLIISSLYFSLWFVNANVTWVEDNVCILTIL